MRVSGQIPCPHCGKPTGKYDNPTPTVDVVIYDPARGVVLVERKNFPPGWALPGGFVDTGERVETAAVREAREETGLDVVLTSLLGVYSDPERDPRQHTMSVVFTAQTSDPDALTAGDDAGNAKFFPLDGLPAPLAFDHARILKDFEDRLARLAP
ncbi:NUDIX hydrolase [Oceanidesulfovibrio marinus]|uniref:NUDIX hydrolase n=1 Tax=Oceanidesulfovibrio marinus TaxID=370038 RepID=A0A6P1ZID5_9BACT|nr:NUDIX hydrolase [Oceanidesulfovibrio marinus]TVM34548.1 NUDIX hydrolase [Oceanidesulfovibrio marinus]